MAWEKRGNGRYYYRKRRDGRRVMSEYVGAGPQADASAMLDVCERQDKVMEQEIWRQQRDAELELDREIDAVGDFVRVLTKAVLLATTHHTHKGQWRKDRE